jgi:hypothetical protein
VSHNDKWETRSPGIDGNLMDLRGIGYEEVDCTDLAQERVHWLVLLNIVMNLRVT